MSKGTSRLVSIERAVEIMEAYGANKDRWPEDERAAAIALVTGSDELQKKLADQQALDDFLGPVSSGSAELSHRENQLLSRIIDNLPEQKNHAEAITVQQRFGQWSSFGAGALAASLFIAVVTFFTLHDSPVSISGSKDNIVQYQELDEWLWNDVTIDVAQLDEEQDDPVSFMSLVDLES